MGNCCSAGSDLKHNESLDAGLRRVVAEGDVLVLRRLLHRAAPDRAAAINKKDSSGNTVLHVAARRGHVDCIQLLLEQGGAVGSQNNEGETPLHLVRQPCGARSACLETCP